MSLRAGGGGREPLLGWVGRRGDWEDHERTVWVCVVSEALERIVGEEGTGEGSSLREREEVRCEVRVTGRERIDVLAVGLE